MDARWWIIHAEQLLRDQSLRVRYTGLDNAPSGREVHWSSGLVWLLAALSIVLSPLTGRAPIECVVQAAFWSGPLLLFASLAFLGWLVGRRFGIGVAGIFLLIFGTSTLIYQCFRAGEADHHGLICVFATGSVFCLIAGGGGLVRRSAKANGSEGPLLAEVDAQKWFVTSGVLGGAALWVSAASFIPVLAGCALGSFCAFFLHDRCASFPAPGLWRSWAAAGCAASLFFYFLEYFPNHLGWRLEVNHPLYAFAWLGGGDLLARLHRRMEGGLFFGSGTKSYLAASAALIAVCAPAVFVLVWHEQCFWVSDKFLLLLHNEFISEFKSLPRSLDKDSMVVALLEMFAWPAFVLFGTVWLSMRGIIARPWRALIGFALVPAIVTQILAVMQVRWSIVAMAMWLLCVLLLLSAYSSRTGPASKIFVAAFAAAMLVASLAFPAISIISLSQAKSLGDRLPKSVIPTVLARDISHRLLQSSPSRLPVVLSGPTPSTEFTYYGGIKTIGTLYWENLDGLKRAARMFAAPSEQHAKVLLEESGVSHIVLTTWDNFGGAYVDLLRQAGELTPGQSQAFIDMLLRRADIPDWLRPLYYPIPAGFGIEGQEVLIFQVIPGQTHAQAVFHRGIFALDQGDAAAAEARFAEALTLDPGNASAQALLNEIRSHRKPLQK